MYHQHNVAFFAAFSSDDIDSLNGVYLARNLIQSAPQFAQYYRAAGNPSDEDLARIVSVETVPDFAGFPERWLDDGDAVFSDPDLPLFRIRLARLAAPDAQGRRSFLLVQLSHVLAEGTDSSLLSRSRSAAHSEVRAEKKAPGWIVAAARAFSWIAAPGHLLVSRFSTPHPSKIVAATRVIEREAPGLAEAMRLTNPLGRLSRARAGAVGRCLVLNTPGSTSGALEYLEAVADVLPHALALLADEPTGH